MKTLVYQENGQSFYLKTGLPCNYDASKHELVDKNHEVKKVAEVPKPLRKKISFKDVEADIKASGPKTKSDLIMDKDIVRISKDYFPSGISQNALKAIKVHHENLNREENIRECFQKFKDNEDLKDCDKLDFNIKKKIYFPKASKKSASPKPEL
jgi:hypothetical protein